MITYIANWGMGIKAPNRRFRWEKFGPNDAMEHPITQQVIWAFPELPIGSICWAPAAAEAANMGRVSRKQHEFS
jgi:hypothetical protein